MSFVTKFVQIMDFSLILNIKFVKKFKNRKKNNYFYKMTLRILILKSKTSLKINLSNSIISWKVILPFLIFYNTKFLIFKGNITLFLLKFKVFNSFKMINLNN